jgi:hypothetical protein
LKYELSHLKHELSHLKCQPSHFNPQPSHLVPGLLPLIRTNQEAVALSLGVSR